MSSVKFKLVRLPWEKRRTNEENIMWVLHLLKIGSASVYLRSDFWLREMSHLTTIGDKIVDSFTLLTPISSLCSLFALLAWPFNPVHPRTMLCGNCCDLELQTTNTEWGSGVLFHRLLSGKKSRVSRCTRSTIERQCVNYSHCIHN